jgi:proteasome beta subunit
VIEKALDASAGVGQEIVARVRGVLQAHYTNYVHVPGTAANPPLTSLLACGYADSGDPWIVEVSEYCQYTRYDDTGFHAIGSGAGFAQLGNALLAHYKVTERPLTWGQVVAWRVVDAAIRTSAVGVGPPIQMWTVTPASGVRRVPDDEMTTIEQAVGGWEEEERVALERTLAAQTAAPEPLPESATEGNGGGGS